MLENCMATITREQVTRHVPFWKKRWRNWKTVIMPLQLLQVWRQFSWYSACLKKAVISLLLVIYTGGSFRLFEVLEKQYGIEFTYWNGEEENDIATLIQPNTEAIFIETPTNPLMQTADLEKISHIAKDHKLLHIVDNTLYSPYFQRPIEQGADIVVHSATKYLAGHNDVLAGIAVVKGEELSEKLAFLHNTIGATLSPLDCWSLIRGMKTLALRMRQHEENAKTVKAFLENHPMVTAVYYPGRSGMLSFEITEEKLVEGFLKALRIFTFA